MKNYIGPRSLNYKKKVEKALKVKSLPTLKKELQDVFNMFIRLRDTKYDKGQAYFICISCSQPKSIDQMHAGHYWPVGGNESIRYDEDNCHGQCIHCNHFKHSNEKGYRINIIRKIGQDRFDLLDIKRHNRSKLLKFEVEILKTHYQSKIQELRKTL